MIRSRSASGRLLDSITNLPIRMLSIDCAKHGCPSPVLARKETTRNLTKMCMEHLAGESASRDESCFRRSNHRTGLNRTAMDPSKVAAVEDSSLHEPIAKLPENRIIGNYETIFVNSRSALLTSISDKSPMPSSPLAWDVTIVGLCNVCESSFDASFESS